jgi:DNA polymerase III subunit epsilon
MITEECLFVAFDTETTGLSAAQGRIVEIAAIKFDLKGNIREEFSQLVNPETEIPEDAVNVHGITNDMLTGMPTIAEVLPRFVAFFSGDDNILVAQNSLFDIGFVNHEAIRCDVKLPRNTIIDQIELSRRAFPDLPTYSLEKTCRRFNLVETQRHRAMADSILVMKLFHYCLKKFETVPERLAVLNSLYHYSFGGPMVVKVDDNMMAIINAALEAGATLEIIYAGGSLKDRPRRIVPALLFNRDGVGFLTAHCLISNTQKHFRLDRIKECRLINTDL